MGVRVRAALRLICAISILSGLAAAQTYYRYDGRVAPAGYSSGPANVAICKTAAATTPCPSPALAYSDQNGVNLLPSSFPADINGNYHFYALAGTYVVQTYGTGYTTTNTSVTLGPQSPGTVVPSTASPVFNVKTYGAVGDARFVNDAVTTNGQPTVTSATAAWTAADVGKLMYCNKNSTGNNAIGDGATVKISAVNSASSVTLSANANSNAGTGQYCVWATQDDTAAFQAAFNAAQQANAVDPNQGTPFLGPSTTIYVPAGGYMVSNWIYNAVNSSLNFSPDFFGAGKGETVIFPSPAMDTNDTSSLLMACQNCSNVQWSNFTVEGAGYAFSGSTGQHALLYLNSIFDMTLRSIAITNLAVNGGGAGKALYVNAANNNIYLENVFIQNAPGGGAFAALFNGSRSVTILSSIFSNFTTNLQFQASGSRGPLFAGISLIHVLTDECNATNGCLVLQGSIIDSISSSHWVGNVASGYAISVDGTSILYATDDNIGTYNNTANLNAINIASGGQVFATMSTIRGNGTAVAVANSGTFYDVGGNTYQNCSGTTCNPATIAQSFSGNQPVEALTHSATNPFIPTDTAQTWMQMTPDQPIRVTRIQVTPANGASVSCTVAPVFQITNGTTTQTLNIANATATDDSGALTSGNTYVSGTAMTFGISAAGTCTTPPANMNVNVMWQSVAPSQ